MRVALACFLILISISPILPAVMPISSPEIFVIDDSHVLSEKVSNGLNQLLRGSAKKRNIHVKVILLNDENADDIALLAKQKVSEWEALTKSSKRKSAYLFVNLALREGIIVLGDNFHKKPALNQSIERIQSKIVINALEKGYVENAVLEAAVAITTVLDDWPRTKPRQTFWQSSSKWLSQHHLTMPLQISIGLLLCYLGWLFFNRQCRRPQLTPAPHFDQSH